VHNILIMTDITTIIPTSLDDLAASIREARANLRLGRVPRDGV